MAENKTKALAAALSQIEKQFGKVAQQRSDEYSLDRMVGKVEALYNELNRCPA